MNNVSHAAAAANWCQRRFVHMMPIGVIGAWHQGGGGWDEEILEHMKSKEKEQKREGDDELDSLL